MAMDPNSVYDVIRFDPLVTAANHSDSCRDIKSTKKEWESFCCDLLDISYEQALDGFDALKPLAFLESPVSILQDVELDESSPSECSTKDLWSPETSVYGDHGQAELSPAEDGPRLNCSKCHTKFETSYALEQHAKLSGHKTFVCQFPGCYRSYTRRDSWTRHRRTHEVELMCLVCRRRNKKKVFKRRDHLRTHIRNCHPDFCLPAETITPSLDPHQDCTHHTADCSWRAFLDAGDPETFEGPEYNSRAVRDFVSEMSKIHGDRTDVVRALKENLNLDHNSTTDQLARSLSQLIIKCPEILRQGVRSES